MYHTELMHALTPNSKSKKSNSRKTARIRGSEDTRQKILSSAAKVIANEGVKNATIRKIASEAKVSGGLIMQYFGSKAELIHDIFRSGNQPLSDYLRTHLDQFNSPEELVMGAMRIYLPRDLKKAELTRQIMAHSWTWSTQDETKYSGNLKELADIVATALQEKFYPEEVFLTTTATYALVSAYVAVLRMGLQRGWNEQTYINVMTPAFQMILSGLDVQIRQNTNGQKKK